MAAVRGALQQLPDDAARARVLRWASDASGLAVSTGPTGTLAATGGNDGSLAALLDRAHPDGRSDVILAVAYWLESSSGGSDWTAQALNDQLKHLGEGVPEAV